MCSSNKAFTKSVHNQSKVREANQINPNLRNKKACENSQQRYKNKMDNNVNLPSAKDHSHFLF